MSRFSSANRLVVVAALAAAAGAVPARAQQQVSEARVAELVALAEARLQAGQTPAPSPAIRLTLSEAVDLALKQNLDISAEQLNPRIQDLSVALVRTAFSPSVNSTVGQRSQARLPTSQLNGGQRVLNDTSTYNAGVSQTVPWFGGSASLSWNNSKLVTTDLFTLFNPQYVSTLTAQYTQPLLKNLWIDSTRRQLATSRISRELSDIQLRAVITVTLANTRNAYWDLVYATQAVDVARRSLALAEKLVEDNKIRVEVGALAKIDIVQAEAEAATRRQALALAEATQQTTELALKRLIVSGTADPLWDAPIDPIDRPSFSAEAVDIKAAVRSALEKRTDLVQARRQLDSNDITIKYLKNQQLPQLDLVASYGAQGLGGTRFDRDRLGGTVTAEYPGYYKDALAHIKNREFPTWNVQLNLTYPIGRSSAEIQYARARLQRDQTHAEMKALELTVATEVTSTALSVRSTQKRVEAATAARALAQQRLEAEQSKFDVGMSTNFFVVQAQRDLADAQITELRAQLDYRKALVDFQRVQEVSAARASVSTITSGGQ